MKLRTLFATSLLVVSQLAGQAPPKAPAPAPLPAQPAVRKSPPVEIRVGATLPLTGRLGAAGAAVQRGILAAMGSAEGLPLRLIVRDDRNSPVEAASNVEALAVEEKVSVILCLRDGAALEVAGAAARAYRVPVIGVGGIDAMRRPLVRSWFAARASYATEGLLVARKLVAEKLVPVQLVAEDDEIGREIRRGMLRVLKPTEILGVDSKGAGARAYLFALDPARAADAIRKLPTNVLRIVASTAPIDAVMRILGGNAEGVVGVTPLPYFTESRLPLARAYRAAMGQQPLDMLSWEAYFSARLAVEGLRRAAGDYSSESVIAVLEGVDAEIEGLPSRFSAGSHEALDQVWLARISTGAITATDRFAK